MWKAAMLGAVLLPACLSACAGNDGPERVVELRNATVVAARDAPILKLAMLEHHNDERRAVGLAPLVWDDTLTQHALAYARELARTRKFEHARQPDGPGREGENLFTGTLGAYSFDEMVQFWIDEKKWFVNRAAPDVSTTGRGEDVGHYTQMIWRTTTKVGCAIASSKWDDYLVCRYAPAGNIIGQKAL